MSAQRNKGASPLRAADTRPRNKKTPTHTDNARRLVCARTQAKKQDRRQKKWKSKEKNKKFIFYEMEKKRRTKEGDRPNENTKKRS
ncbi:hypothetical protein [Pandoravirus japonicus]|uniref:Uncharacterized protein n=1 Tax=Pandoravirus japonicus TaxID=2823154 RepID=A0A811BR88_9VIRU|nr:hypothetical protein [Pandoravirus japonicus]